MTVAEYFSAEKITLELVETIAEERDESGLGYWTSVHKFLKDNWTVDWKQLSIRQTNWINRILDDCVEYRIESRQR